MTALNQVAPLLTETQAVAAVATTISVFIALYVTVFREPRHAAEEAKRHRAQVDALRRVVRERIAAQARKVVPFALEPRCLAIRGGQSESTTRAGQ